MAEPRRSTCPACGEPITVVRAQLEIACPHCGARYTRDPETGRWRRSPTSAAPPARKSRYSAVILLIAVVAGISIVAVALLVTRERSQALYEYSSHQSQVLHLRYRLEKWCSTVYWDAGLHNNATLDYCVDWAETWADSQAAIACDQRAPDRDEPFRGCLADADIRPPVVPLAAYTSTPVADG